MGGPQGWEPEGLGPGFRIFLPAAIFGRVGAGDLAFFFFQPQLSCYLHVVKDSGVCLLVVHVCRTVDRVVSHPRPSLAVIRVPWVSLSGPTDVP